MTVNRALGLPTTYRVEIGTYDFNQLVEWKKAILGSLMSDDAVQSIDIDERENAVSVTVDDAAALSRVRAVARDGKLPDVAFSVSVSGRTIPSASTILGRNRPLTGGFAIGPIECTMAGTAYLGADRLLITASHCTASKYLLDYGSTYQGNAADPFGIEQIDPKTYSCGGIIPKHCRRADVAAYNVNYIPVAFGDTLSWYPGLIAHTQFPSNGVTQMNGSFDVDSLLPYWTVTATSNSVMVGNTLHKVGKTTGWTYGDVTRTCIDKKDSISNVWIVCSDVAGVYDDAGDSGSPVFIATGGLNATFVGLIWGNDPGASVVISNFGQMKQDLGVISFW
ncbi:MAG: hypothetical protein ABJC26_01530 [Gemmatimonadaceae bacterium]